VGARLKDLMQQYINEGYQVIPVLGKVPMIKNWQKFSLAKVPDSPMLMKGMTGFGLVLGPASGVVAVDIDTDDIEILNSIPKSPVVRRGKKGEVRFFQHSVGLESRTYRSILVEILSTGRQVVLPPSIHPDTKAPYEWTSDKSLLTLPKEMLPILDLSFLNKLINKKEFTQAQAEPVGRNNKLKEMASAMFFNGKALEQVAYEILEYDKQNHSPSLFSDIKEFTTPDEVKNSTSFCLNIFRSLLNSNLLPQTLPPKEGQEEIQELEDNEKDDIQYKPYPMPQGLLSDICGLIDEKSYTSIRAFNIAGAISILSAAIGRKYIFQDMYSNCFVLILGNSGVGKKFSIQVAKDVFKNSKTLMSADFTSSPAIYKSIKDYSTNLAVSEEFSKVIKSASSDNIWQSNLQQDFCSLWAASSDDFMLPTTAKEKEGEEDKVSFVKKPFMSILASTTIEGLKSDGKDELITSGMLPRFLFFLSKEAPIPKDTINIQHYDQIYNIVSDKVNSINTTSVVQNAYTGIETPIDGAEGVRIDILEKDYPIFKNIFSSFYEKSKDISDKNLIKPFLNRSREYFKKLSLIHAISRTYGNPSSIEPIDMLWAEALINAANDNLGIFLDQDKYNNFQKISDKILRQISSEKEGISKRSLLRKNKGIASKELETFLIDLEKRGYLYSLKKGKTIFYCALSKAQLN